MIVATMVHNWRNLPLSLGMSDASVVKAQYLSRATLIVFRQFGLRLAGEAHRKSSPGISLPGKPGLSPF